MSFSPAFKWSIFLLLLLTLGWKAAVHLIIKPGADEENASRRAADFFIREHFNVSVEEKYEGQATIRAIAGPCRVLAMQVSPVDWHREILERNAGPADSVFVVFDGKVYSRQPIWLTVPNALWAKFRGQLGLKTSAKPVWFIIAPKSCDADRLPWHQLS